MEEETLWLPLPTPLFKINENFLTALLFITSVLTILLSVATFGDAYAFSVGDAFPLGRIIAGAICLVFTIRTVLGPITSQDIWQSTDRFVIPAYKTFMFTFSRLRCLGI